MAGIYIHIPFCRQACTYCNFHFSTSLRLKEDILAAIAKEIDLQHNYLEDRNIKTIYFGGGTPSLLTAEEINRIIDKISRYYNLEHLDEVTLEANPDDLNTRYLKELNNTVINRFSIGVQSFYDNDLNYMNRAHNSQQADYSIKAAQDASFTNLTIDLIYGTPGLSDANWLHNLKMIEVLQIPHFSAYALTVEEGTALHHNIKVKKATPVDAEQSAGQFEILMDRAKEMGYEHYEISNLAKPGHRAVHNTNYWLGLPYLGIGPSAHSFNGTSRGWNIANNALYMKSILAENKLNFEAETLTSVQQLNEYIMTSLRTMWGVDLEKIAAQWGENTRHQLIENAISFIKKGQAEQKDNNIILTRQGKLFADSIAGTLFFD